MELLRRSGRTFSGVGLSSISDLRGVFGLLGLELSFLWVFSSTVVLDIMMASVGNRPRRKEDAIANAIRTGTKSQAPTGKTYIVIKV
jgi:hypothetical protein